MRRLAGALAAAAIAMPGCYAARLADGGATATPAYRVVEHAADGDYAVTRTSALEFDVNAEIRVTFPSLAAAPATPADDREWTALSALLEDMVRLGNERRRLNALPSDAAALDEGVRAFNTAKAAAKERLAQFGLSEDEITAIRREVQPGRTDRDTFENFAIWARRELDRREAAARATAEAAQVWVQVQALLDPIEGDAQPVHVENYDELPVGKYDPVDRLGLRMKDAERARFERELAAARRAADLVRRVGVQRDALHAALMAVWDDVRRAAEELAAALAAVPDAWPDAVAAALVELGRLAAAGDRDAVTLRDALLAVQADAERLRAARAAVARLVSGLRDATDPLALVDAAQQAADAITALAASAAEWPARLEAVARALPAVAPRLTAAAATALLPPELRERLDRIGRLAAAAVGVVARAAALVADNRGVVRGLDAVSGAEIGAIAHRLGAAPPAVIQLARTRAVDGDHLTILVKEFTQDPAEGPATPDRTETLTATLRLVGFHRVIGGNFVFARADTDAGSTTAQTWRPGIAATASWHYRIREPEHLLSDTWNWLNPGVGVHLAHLNQTDDAVEIGAGGSVVLFDGLLVGGMGWNLSIDSDRWRDRAYYFFGINLLDVLDRVGVPLAPARAGR